MKIEVKYAPTVGRFLKQFGSSVMRQMPNLMRAMGDRLRYSMQKNIQQSRTPDGRPYPPIKEPRKRLFNENTPPLYDSGLLFNSIHRLEPVESAGVWRIETGHNIEYGIYQNQGTVTAVPGHPIPARAFIGIREGDIPDSVLADFTVSIWHGGQGGEPSFNQGAYF